MQVVTCQQMKKLLNRDINYRRFSDDDLVLSCAMSLQQVIRRDNPTSVLIVCGNLENGNYGLSLATLLRMDGIEVTVIHNDFKNTKYVDIFNRLKMEVVDSERNVRRYIEEATYIVDCIYGIELDEKIAYPYSYWIDWINNSNAYVLSCDIPSGVNGDDGSIFGCCVNANKTVCFQLPKLGLYLYPSNQYVGNIMVESIGLSIDSLESVNSNCYICDDFDIKNMVPQRVSHSHKGTYGKVLLIAGSEGKVGAALLTGKALLKSGCGLLTVMSYKKVCDAINSSLYEAMTIEFNEDNYRDVADKADFDSYDLIVLGCGLGRNRTTESLMIKALQSKKTVVLDADGLYFLKENISLLKRPALTVLTPHLEEYKRIYDYSETTIVEDLSSYTSENKNLIICLKGENTLTSYQGSIVINNTGNNALAKGGSGDVLTGVIGGLLAQNNVVEAVVAAVYIHSKAADIWVERHSHYSLLATDLIDMIDDVLFAFTKR